MMYFIDFEASSLLPGSFPIEVGWVDEEGKGEQHLIRPHPKWLERNCPGWSTASEAIHGISLETLVRDGSPIDYVAARAAEVLFAPDAITFADQPGWDGQWLDALFEYGGVPGRIELLDVNKAYREACHPLQRLELPLTQVGRDRAEEYVADLITELVDRARKREALRTRTQHRALSDAESLWQTWRSVSELAVELLAKEAGP